ncbi:uncharacterized protein CCOS01_14582 [Colletotrichum costaricense]|uniref:Uncharacterized protein n=1 Tax=Colletotrichum costaricense TaxID=1209916 RepID=A0AAJ0DTY2_9PEZI|nr:uncharacterized protein CCOS01_14582 [Colletotrichum costaricense]KAK1512342.1 hypothetical protein CCOS01_14582 [Colletotrichum costaricense]
MVRVGWPHALLFRLQQSPRFYQYVCMYVCMVNVCAPRKSGENAARSVRVCRLCLPASLFFRLHLCALLSIAPDSSRCGQIQLLVRFSCGMFFGEQLLGVGHLSAREWSLNCLCSMRYQPMLASLICPPSTSQRCTRRLGLPFTLLCLSHSLSLLASRLCLASGSCCLCCSHSSSSSSHTRGTITIRRQCLCASLPLVWSPSP